MKNGQLVIGLLIGAALGALVANLAATTSLSSGGISGKSISNRSEIETIVRETMANEGKLIMDAVAKAQTEEQSAKTESANTLLKDEAVRNDIYNDSEVAFIGPADSKRVVAEFFDYNCPACKMQYKAINDLVAKDKDVKVVFHEFPIFGPQSDTNSKIGLAVWHVAPAKYIAYHEKMMTFEGRAAEKDAYDFVKAIGANVAKVKAYAESPEATAAMEKSRDLGQKLGVRGTPSLFIGAEMIPHAAPVEEIEAKLGAK